MDNSLGASVWKQFGAAIDMLDNAVAACPNALWTERLWQVPASSDYVPQFAEFWYLAFHTLFCLDLYLADVSEEEFVHSAPFPAGDEDSAESRPEQPYTKEQVRAYLAVVRQKCHDTLIALTDEQAFRIVAIPWLKERSVNYLELQLYNMRHVQEHAAQMSLLLGQHVIPNADETLHWVAQAKGAQSNS